MRKSCCMRMQLQNISSEWFRSTDLWVMGPARFHCATLLTLLAQYKLIVASSWEI